jgi:hypothetical protein
MKKQTQQQQQPPPPNNKLPSSSPSSLPAPPPPLSQIILYVFLSWFIPLTTAFAFYSPPEDNNKPPQLSVEKTTFKTAMVLIGSSSSLFLLSRILLRPPNLSLKPEQILERIVFEAIPICSVFLCVNLVLDVLILIPMSGQTFKDYFIDIGGRYVGTIFAVAFFIENLVVATRDKMEPTYNVLEDEPGLFPTLFQIFTRAPLVWATPYVFASFFYQEHKGDSSPLVLVTSSALYETIMLNIRIASQLYFLYRGIQHISTPRLKKWGIITGVLFWFINTVLDLFISFPVVRRRPDVKNPERYVAEMIAGNLTLIVWGMYASYYARFCETNHIVPRSVDNKKQ